MYQRYALEVEFMSNTSSINRLSSQPFGKLSTGESAQLFTLTNSAGMQVNITNYGGIIVSIFAFDKTQRLADVVLGYDCVADYEQDSYYLGAVIGPYAGRIEQGQLDLDGKKYQLNLNAPDSQLHGGKQGLNKKLWQASTSTTDNSACLSLTYSSPDGEEGFPGNVDFTVKYHLNDDNELLVEYFASTDQTTIVNLTQHSYFNLAGHNSGDIHQHQVEISANLYLPMNEQVYPTGELVAVSGSAHDFTNLRTLGDEIDGTDEQIRIGLGYDNYWLVNDDVVAGDTFAARAVDPASGRRMTVFSDQPSMILYTANYIDGSHVGKGNYRYQRRAALCLEPQRANSAMNGVGIENTKLTPDQPFYSQSRYVFDTI